jgi:Fe-S cluster assembly protein SufD
MLQLKKSLKELFKEPDEEKSLRLSYWKRFQQSGLPTTKEEDWKYTDIFSLYAKHNINFRDNTNRESKPYLLESLNLDLDLDSYNIVFYAGKVLYDPLLQQGVNIKLEIPNLSLNNIHGKSSLESLNQAISTGGISLEVLDNIIVEKPVIISYVQDIDDSNNLINYRNNICIGNNSKIIIHERFICLSPGKSALNISTTFNLSSNSSCKFDRDKGLSEESLLLTYHCKVNLATYADFSTFHLISNHALIRYDFSVKLNGKHASFDSSGVYLLSGKTHFDYHFHIKHLNSYTQSNVNFRGVVTGCARAVFSPKTIAAKQIHSIRAVQNNHNLQLTKSSRINTKPQLEIYSDDVQCSHGATIGKFDKDAIFYLQSRGIPERDARQLLVESFSKEIILSLSREKKKIDYYTSILSEYLKLCKNDI